MTLRSFLLLWSALFVSSQALATEVTCNPQDVRICSQSLKEGDVAALTGILLSPRKLAVLVAKAEQTAERVALAKEEARELEKAAEASYEARIKNLEASHKLERDLMLRRMEEMEKLAGPKWYEHPALWCVIGIAGATASYFIAVKVIQASNP